MQKSIEEQKKHLPTKEQLCPSIILTEDSDYLLESFFESYVEEKTKQREYYLQSMYNISLDDFNALYNAQDCRCRVCKEKKQPHELVVDHKHEADNPLKGNVRGLLCNNCNILLGHAKDNIKILNNAIKYLENSNKHIIFIKDTNKYIHLNPNTSEVCQSTNTK